MNPLQHLDASLWLPTGGCAKLFLDAGANDGDAVSAFFRGTFHRCALHSPNRLYGQRWHNATGREKAQRMAPLADAKSWCVRSFEANPHLLPHLRTQEEAHRAEGRDVRFVDGLLGNTTGTVTRDVIKYSRHPLGSTVSHFDFKRVQSGAMPVLATESLRGPAFDVRDVVRRAVELNPEVVIGMRLDVEGDEYRILDSLASTDGGSLLCSISYLFVEHHNLHVNTSHYDGLDEHAYSVVGNKVHALMNRPGCKLHIYWRNFWSACGDPARYVWMKSAQATGRNASEMAAAAAHSKKRRARGRRGRRLNRNNMAES